MRNKTTGKYEVYKRFNRNGQTFTGHGDTQEAAAADLKNQLAPYKRDHGPGTNAYYDLPMEPTGETFRSPGVVLIDVGNNQRRYKNDQNNQAAVFANPDLAKLLRERNVKGE